MSAKIEPLHKDVLVYDMYFGEQKTSAGIILMDDDKTDRGIHPRWAKVYAVGSENRDGIEPEEWVLIEHGRWSRGIDLSEIDSDMEPYKTVVRRVDPGAILLKTKEDPEPATRSGIIGPIGAK